MTNSRDFEIVSDALRSISFPISHDKWARIGLALYAHFGEQGMQLLYDASCAPFPQYQHETPAKLAARFRSANGKVTLATIFHLARAHGWKHSRPNKIQGEVWHLVAWHDYLDAHGNLAYRINRLASPDGKRKRMTIERYDNGKKEFNLPAELRVPYNLPNVIGAIERGETIYFVEGESDADALNAHGFVATCIPFGASGWNNQYTTYFTDARICFIPDNDVAGKALPLKAIPDLASVAKEIGVIELSDVKDVRELLNSKGLDAFLSLKPIDASDYLSKCAKDAYPLQTLITPTPADESDLDDESELPELDSYANIDFGFDENLVPSGLFREVYNHFKSEADAPPQFIFTASLAAFMGIIGTRISLTCGTIKVKPHDYFAFLTKSGNGKSTSLETCRAVLDAFEKKIINKPYTNVVLFPQSSTLRGLLDCMREESEFELRAREALEAKGKPTPPPKVAQRSGVAIIDEVSALFDSTRNEFNSGLDATLLLLWDGAPRMIATSAKNDGKMKFEDSALTLLSASTPKKFVERLPKGAMLDGMIPRFQIVFADNRKQPRKALTSLTKSQANHDAIVDKLLSFFQFVCTMSSKPVIVSDEAKSLDEQSVEKWYEESLRLDDETADGYMQRIDTRKLRYALLFSALETYDQHGQFADGITISETAMERAIRVCEFFKTHSLHFVVKAKAIRPKAPNENEPLSVRVKNKLIELGGTADARTLQRALTLKKETFTDALNELLATKQVVLIQRENAKGRLVDVVTIPKNSKQGSDSSDTLTVCENNTTETSLKQQNASHCQKSKCQNGSDTLTQKDVASPEPMPELLERVLSELPTGEIFTRGDILLAVQKHAPTRVREIGTQVREHILRLGASDRYIHRDDAKRPNGYRGLIDQNGDGIINDEPLPMNFEKE